MAEQFTYIKFEYYFVSGVNSTWIDITSDVLLSPSPKCSRGISGNGPLDMVAAPGQLTFSLKNGTSSSGGVGYYTPGHANVRDGWDVGVAVRLTFAYDTWVIYKWYGKVDPDGIKVIPGTLEERRVEVVAHDFMYRMMYTKVELLQIQTNKYPYEAIESLLTEITDGGPAGTPTNQPLETDLQQITLIQFPTVFDAAGTDTTILGEFQKIALSARRHIFVRGGVTSGEILTYSNPRLSIPTHTLDSGALLLETGDELLLETGGTDYLLLDDEQEMDFDDGDLLPGSQFVYGKHLYDHVTTITYPRRVDAAATTILWKLNEAKKITAGESVTIRGTYNDPNGSGNTIRGTDFVTPVSGTDFAAFANSDGTGTNLTANMTVTATFGAAEVELVIENTGGTDFYTGGNSIVCRVRGRGVYFDDPVRIITENASGIAVYGFHPLSIDKKYRNEETSLEDIRTGDSDILDQYGAPFYSIDRLNLWANKDTFNMTAFLFGEPLTRSTITEEMNGLSGMVGYMVGYDFEIIEGADGSPNVNWHPIFKTTANEAFPL